MFASIISAVLLTGAAVASVQPQGGMEESPLFSKIPLETLYVLPEKDDIMQAYASGMGCDYKDGEAMCFRNGQSVILKVVYHEVVFTTPLVGRNTALICTRRPDANDDQLGVFCIADRQVLSATVRLVEEREL